MRRRGVGVGAMKAKERDVKAYETLGKEIQDANIQHVTALTGTFKESLEEFARKYKKDINANPLLRAEFQKMCRQIGVDPLASNKGFWAQLLGVGDFYYELAVQIIEICLVTRSANGGLISLSDLTKRLRARRKLDQISEEDVKTAISKVHKLGSGFRLLEYGGNTLVVSVPLELSSDHTSVLSLAQTSCFVTKAQIQRELRWQPDRMERTLQALLQSGMAWVDSQAPNEEFPTRKATVYWFPSLWQQRRSEAGGSSSG